MTLTIQLEVEDVIELIVDGPVSEGKSKIVRQLAKHLSMDNIRNEILLYFMRNEEEGFEDIIKSNPEYFTRINQYFGALLWDSDWKDLLS